jgi:hypothetical protein
MVSKIAETAPRLLPAQKVVLASGSAGFSPSIAQTSALNIERIINSIREYKDSSTLPRRDGEI